MSLPLILTLQMDEHSSSVFEHLRQEHFPPDRNLIPAHLTLFHKLPAQAEDSIRKVLEDLVQTQLPLRMEATSLRFLGRGVAYVITSPTLLALRATLAERWSEWLTAQDRQPFKPHVTIQNKAPAIEARALYNRLSLEFQQFAVDGTGLLLWKYIGGPWEPIRRYPFPRELL